MKQREAIRRVGPTSKDEIASVPPTGKPRVLGPEAMEDNFIQSTAVSLTA